MALMTSLRAAASLARHGRFPSRRRCRQVEARWAFDGALEELGPLDIAIDCGANVGKFTTRMAATGATVYAFEPDPHAFERLRCVTQHYSNVITYNQAVGATEAQVKLYRTPDYQAEPLRNSVSSSLYATKDNVDSDSGVSVEQIDLPAFIDRLAQPVVLLKIDIEGAEVPLLEAMIARGTLERVGYVYVETHEKRIPALAPRTAKLRAQLCATRYGRVDLNWR